MAAASPIPLNQRPTIVKPPLPTPSHGSAGAVFSLTCSTVINAPLTTILTSLLDTRAYPDWNAFVTSISIRSQPSAPASPPACLADSPVLGLETTLQKGTSYTLHVKMDTKTNLFVGKNVDTTVVCSVLEDFERDDGQPGVRVAWSLDSWTPGFMLKTERVQELVDVGGGAVEYRCFETFYGMLASTVRSFVGDSLQTGFGQWMDSLKAHAEKAAHESEQPTSTDPTVS
ncbi:hypothetical protein B0T10DRAFT_239538 [Thelonectria olida]|uniref:Coenzyme Q-binding protein COQ10 START domain-containing protein n=1 Tax=Thelonectria olida TaxID=1576542 RepID=A0A9P8WAB7_9HYPO|nr:hypothetical protein B0T10DRAFT_239538 [Thelonectria olida]